MELTGNVLYIIVFVPIVALVVLGIIIIIGNNNILRAGGQTAHENYPKVIEHVGKYFVFILDGFALFFLAIVKILPSEALISIVSIIIGAYGALKIKEK